MHRDNHSGSWKQLPLALNLNADSESLSVLHAAYSRLKLSRRLTFEQVMTDRALAIGIRHLADAIARRRATGNPTKSIPTARGEMAISMDPEFDLQPEPDFRSAEYGDH